MTSLSATRAAVLTNKEGPLSNSVFEAYANELLVVYKINKEAEDAMKAKDEAKKKADDEKVAAAGKDDKKKGGAKKKGKDGPSQIGFGKGTRALFDYLQYLEVECGKDQDVFLRKLNFFKNRELQSIVREITEL